MPNFQHHTENKRSHGVEALPFPINFYKLKGFRLSISNIANYKNGRVNFLRLAGTICKNSSPRKWFSVIFPTL